MEAREVPHKGGRTYGYRVSDGHSVLTLHCPTIAPPWSAPGQKDWASTTRLSWTWRPVPTC